MVNSIMVYCLHFRPLAYWLPHLALECSWIGYQGQTMVEMVFSKCLPLKIYVGFLISFCFHWFEGACRPPFFSNSFLCLKPTSSYFTTKAFILGNSVCRWLFDCQTCICSHQWFARVALHWCCCSQGFPRYRQEYQPEHRFEQHFKAPWL